MNELLVTTCRVQRSNRIYLRNSRGDIIASECNKCHIMKHVGDYDTHKRKATGLQTYCRPCDRKIRRENYRRKVASHVIDKESIEGSKSRG